MAKIHARMSVEIEVSDEEFRRIYELSRNDHTGLSDVSLDEIDIDLTDTNIVTPCDWDDDGYIPGAWLEYDAEEAEIGGN